MSQPDKAALFHRLHQGPGILVLPNVWDVASARIVEQAGFPAIATSSAGVAFALGYPDGERISRDEMTSVVARIVAHVAVPVTADMEAGYGRGPEDAAATVRAVIAAGAVGMNFEDSPGEGGEPLLPEALQVERVRAAREAADATGVPFVLNARTDVFLEQVGEPAGRLAHAVRRLNAYRSAGADCLFAPGVSDAATIAMLVKEVRGPLNVLAVAASPPIRELERLGVARVSLGSGPMRAGLTVLRRIAEELRTAGTYGALAGAIPHADLNRLLGQ
jgi:2-methylisocitrate lyase-like PEP mutase family enzyme